jgi:spore coat polysaccharide biosynthesis protein SpsF|tara:strand:- start:700 stop:1464 length:765 start_codon:yes stop_codon:yes gene_type:complete
MIGCIIQARMGSSRLPGKTLKLINGNTPMLKFQLNQLKFSKLIDKIIIATTILESDHVIVDFCNKNNFEFFRGEVKDVLDRYYQCAKKNNFPIIVRITSDNPLIDPKIVDDVIHQFLNSDCDYMSTEYPKTYPLGFAVEIFNFKSLEKSWMEAKLPSEREHVTPFLLKNKNIFKHCNHSYEKNLSHIRCTVDTDNDFKLIEKIAQKLNMNPIHLENVLDLLSTEPDLLEINRHIKHDGYERSLKEDDEFLKNND